MDSTQPNHSLSREVQAALLQHLPVPVLACSAMHPGLPIRFANPAALRHVAVSLWELQNQPLAHLFAPGANARTIADLHATVQRQQGGTWELQLSRKDGSLFWAELDIKPVVQPGHSLTHFVVVFQDISARKKAAQRLAELTHLCNNGPVVFCRWEVAAPYRFLWVTENIRNYGYEPADLLSGRKAWMDIVHPDDRQKEHEYVLDCQARVFPGGPNVAPSTYRIVCADGTVRWLFDFTVAVFDSSGKQVCADGYLIDITSLKEAEHQKSQMAERMREAQQLQAIGILAGGLAHDFNNLLTTVLGYANLAADEIPASWEAHAYLLEIDAAARRAATLCQQMLAYAGKGRMVAEPIDLNRLVQESLKIWQRAISDKGALSLRLATSVSDILGDANQIRQAVVNLLTNAAEALRDGMGLITVATGQQYLTRGQLEQMKLGDALEEGDYVWVQIRDTGCGIAPEIQTQIFDPFFSTKFTGRGLGLAAVLGIVRSHKGAVELVSVPGQGSTFRLLFPQAPRTPAVTASAPETTSDIGKGTILVVDDEPGIRSLLCALLPSMGYQVLGAASGEEALDLVRTRGAEFRAVLLDLSMLPLQGPEVCAEIQRLAPNLPVLVMSGYSEEDVREQFQGLKPAGFLGKPFNRAEVEEKLNAIPDQPSPH